jgi:hypothetical protein
MLPAPLRPGAPLRGPGGLVELRHSNDAIAENVLDACA